MRAVIRWLAAWLALASMGHAAHAEWLEASNKHFVVYGNMSPRQMTTFTDRLERFGAAVRYLFKLPEPEGGTANRVTIYVVGGVGAVQHFYSGKSGNVAGFYRSDAAGSFIVTPSTVNIGNDAFDANLVLFHEYAHHLLLGNSAALYPGWVSEGMAELLSTARITDDGNVVFGWANNARGSSILADNPMAVKTLLETDQRKLDSNGTEQKYARGWLLVHYLLLSGKRSGQFDTFLELIAKGVPGADAGTQAFGDLKRLNGELNSYRQGRLNGLTIKAEKFTVDPVKLRTMTPAEASIMPLRLESATGVSTAEARKLLPPARKIAAANPDNAWIQRVLGEMEFDAGNDAEAEAACDRALAAEPGNLMAMVYKARVHLRRAATAKPSDPALWRDARRWVVKANRIAPDYALPLVLFYSSYAQSGDTPSPNAVTGLLRAVQLAPQDDGVRMLAFMAMLEKGDLPAARALLAAVAFDPHSAGDSPARAIVSLIDSGADLTAVVAATKTQLIGNGSASPAR